MLDPARVPQAEDVFAVDAGAEVGEGRFGRHGQIGELQAAIVRVAGGQFAEQAVGVFVSATDPEEVQGDRLSTGAFDEGDEPAVAGTLRVYFRGRFYDRYTR